MHLMHTDPDIIMVPLDGLNIFIEIIAGEG